jgi:hypothetical protein
MSAPLVRGVALALLLTYLPACTTWRVRSNPTQAVIMGQSDKTIRLTLRDGSRVELDHPWIVGDSVVTTRPRARRFGTNGGERSAVALDDIRFVETREVSGGRTAVLLVGVGLAALAVAAAAQSEDPPPAPPPRSDGPPIMSCPLVYSWDGRQWRLDSGTFGGAITRRAARTDVDNLLYATPEGDRLSLKLANELNETDYVNALSVLVVDHDSAVTVAPDGNGKLHTLGALRAPLGATDFRGRDVLNRVVLADEFNWESAPFGRDPARSADIRDGLDLTFVRDAGAAAAKLVIDGRNTTWAAYMLGELVAAHGTATAAWYDSLDTQPQYLHRFGAVAAHTGFLGVSVMTGDEWEHQGYVWEAGPEIAKRQVFPLDLSRVRGDTVRVRLESAPSYWLIDRIALDQTIPGAISVEEIRANRAIDHTGRDVAAWLAAVDDRELVMETGDYAELEFAVPPLVPGKMRSFLVRSTGWYRVHTDETAPPQVAMLSEVWTDRDAASRISVERMNEAWRVLGSVN